jgi:hypothetical protein
MEPNIDQMEKWLEDQELHLREACRSAAGRERGSTKRPALGPVLAWLGWKQPEKALK